MKYSKGVWDAFQSSLKITWLVTSFLSYVSSLKMPWQGSKFIEITEYLELEGTHNYRQFLSVILKYIVPFWKI